MKNPIKEFLKSRQHVKDLMCTDVCRVLAHVIYDKRFDELKDKHDELLKSCKYKVAANGVKLMREATPEFRKFYNEEIINYSVRVVEDIGVYKIKRKGSLLQVWCDRPGLFIGYKGTTLKSFLEFLPKHSFNNKITHLDKVKKVQFKGNRNPFKEGSHSLQFLYI